MNMPIASAPKSRPHPMLIIASSAVVLVCLVASAALMGWVPNSRGAGTADDVALLSSESQATSRGSPQQNAVKGPAQRAPVAPAPATRASAEPARRTPALVCQHCGVVESVREITTRGDGSGLGAAGGAVVGGLLGNQVGGGHGREAMTVVGAIGGAFAGNQIEKQAKSSRSYETTVRMNNGASRTVAQTAQPAWHDGDRVKIVDGVVRMNG
jgi:outer membrane lipoprotein SlyB